MSSHADTIRQHFEPGFAEDDKVLAALDALLAENQRLCEALERIVRKGVAFDAKGTHSKAVCEIAREALAGDAE